MRWAIPHLMPFAFSRHAVSMALLACLIAGQAHAGAVDKLHRFFETTKTMRADFAQIVTAKNGKRPQQSTGVMMFSRPGKFRWQIERPYSQLLVGDGEKVWIYDPDLRQVTVKRWAPRWAARRWRCWSVKAMAITAAKVRWRGISVCAKPASGKGSNGWRRFLNRRTAALRNCDWGFLETI